jgi:hypothetical protein
VRDWAGLGRFVGWGRDSGRMQNWTNEAIAIEIKGVGMRGGAWVG